MQDWEYFPVYLSSAVWKLLTDQHAQKLKTLAMPGLRIGGSMPVKIDGLLLVPRRKTHRRPALRSRCLPCFHYSATRKGVTPLQLQLLEAGRKVSKDQAARRAQKMLADLPAEPDTVAQKAPPVPASTGLRGRLRRAQLGCKLQPQAEAPANAQSAPPAPASAPWQQGRLRQRTKPANLRTQAHSKKVGLRAALHGSSDHRPR